MATATAGVDELSVRESREPRVTKAQRRRDKKAEQQRERERAIAEQEVANLEGPRHRETQAIAQRLRQRGRAVHMIPSDGDWSVGNGREGQRRWGWMRSDCPLWRPD